jgi:hypothetical protein
VRSKANKSDKHHRLPHGDSGRAAAKVALRRHDLVVVRPQLQPGLGPRVEVVPRRHRPARPVVLTHSPELLERLRSLDRWLVRPRRLEDVVVAAVRVHRADLLRTRGRVVSPVRLDDVVLDQRVLGPAVDRQVAVAVRLVVGVVVDCAGGCEWLATEFIPILYKLAHRTAPGFHPLPATKLPLLPDHCTLYCPFAPFW